MYPGTEQCKKAGEQWVLDCVTDPCSLTGNEENQTAMRLVSKDLLHWKSEENELEEIEINCRKSDKWIGDVEKQIEFEEDGKIWILSQTAKKRVKVLHHLMQSVFHPFFQENR